LRALRPRSKPNRARLAGLQAKISQAHTVAAQVDEVGQLLRTKKAELAEVNAEIARKSALHGQVDSDLRDLRKRISGDATHP
jgi:DNA repair exonuclease SbcCD ATPase subunit